MADSPPAPMSKNARKRAAKEEYYASIKGERREARNQAKKEKRKERQLKRAAGEMDEVEQEREWKKARMAEPKMPFNARVVVDLAFDEKMTDKEVVSLTSQVAYTYNAHKLTPRPFSSLLFTGLSGRSKDRMDAQNDAGYLRWKNTEWWQDGYEGLWQEPPENAETCRKESEEDAGDNEAAADSHSAAASAEDVTKLPKKLRKNLQRERSRCAQDTVVYLTADAEDELLELKEGETYIIGGIVDHNRYKNLCLNKAQQTGVRAARLPIGTYMAALPTRKVLTVNQVFEILVHWVEARDWEAALNKVMPARKFVEGKKRKKGANVEEAEEDIEEE